MLKKILSVSGKPGLYKLVSQGKSMLIVEALTDGRRLPVYAREKIISLGDIAIYTDGDEVPLYEVLNSVKAKEEGKAASSIDAARATPDQLRAYMAEVLPNFDRERVYPTDIKRLLSWYNLLISAGITDFDPQEAAEEADVETPEATVKETHATPPPVVKNTAPKASAAAKTPVGKSTQRMRQK
jgi:hypothetical protein